MTENSVIFNVRHGARLILSPSIVSANGAGLSKTRKRSKLASDPAAIWGMPINVADFPGKLGGTQIGRYLAQGAAVAGIALIKSNRVCK